MTWRDFADRFGGTLAIIVAVAVLVLLLPATVDSSGRTLRADGTTDVALAEESGLDTAGEGLTDGSATDGSGASATTLPGGLNRSGATATTKPGTTQATTGPAAAAGVKFGTGPDCRSDGRQKAIDTYAPPCVDWPKGTPNGGATGKGVTANKILLIRYEPYIDPGTRAALQGAGATDDAETIRRQFDAYVRYFNTHYQTYGREVVWENFPASSQSGGEESLRADAVAISKKGAFAVIGADSPVMAQELAVRGVLCMCTVTLSRSYYTALPPYVFTTLPTSEEFFENIGEYICKRLVGRPARWAGDELDPTQGFTRKTRKFGLIWYEGAGTTPEPGYKVAHDFFLKRMKESCGVSIVDFGYLADATQAPNYSQAMIAKLLAEGVTTVMFSVDPITPIFFTNEATRQGYYPEWLNMGTALTDQTFFGRTYDQSQWRHSFGISPLGTSVTDVTVTAAYREYFVARPNDRPGSQGVSISVTHAGIALLFTGIHMAGPNLNADSFSKGMFAYPRTGSDPAHPAIQFTRSSPSSIEDFKEIWWNPSATGKDETGKDGVGMMMVADGGKRLSLGGWPTGEPKAFDPNGAVTTTSVKEKDDGSKPVPDSVRCLSC